jgi:hypothetical protein
MDWACSTLRHRNDVKIMLKKIVVIGYGMWVELALALGSVARESVDTAYLNTQHQFSPCCAGRRFESVRLFVVILSISR